MPFDNTAQDTTERAVPAGCTCETCKLLRFEGSAIRNAVVHQYSHRPRVWQMKSIRNDPFDYFLGVELETDNYKIDASTGLRTRSVLTNNQAADMRRPKMFWMAKRDGSVSGPEFVSHPATLSFWQSKEAQLREMFQMLLHAGFRSHDNDKAGMHVNISKNAFTDSAHLFRFLTLLHGNADWSLKVSQRSRTSAEQWASLDYLADATRRQQEVDIIMPTPETLAAEAAARAANPYGYGYSSLRRSAGHGSTHRYQALNCPSGQGRFEFRLPRGTLRLDRFMKNLEWTVAMIEFSRTGRVAGMKSALFMRWVGERQAQYPNLVKFLGERFGAAAVGSPVATTTRTRTRRAVTVADPLADALYATRISPRTGLPVRSYNRRATATRPPGRPVGFSPVRSRRVVAEYPAQPCALTQYHDGGYYCEYTPGHPGEHGAPGVQTPNFGWSGPDRPDNLYINPIY